MPGGPVILFAPDSFKGSISAARAARAMANGWRTVRPTDRVILKPMADGGEGTADAFEAAMPGARRVPVEVLGPDDKMHTASWVHLPATPDAPHGVGVVELANTSGVELLGRKRFPWHAHTRGFGQAIRDAVDTGVSRLVLGIGSSASTDGGTGMLTELGARVLDGRGEPVKFGARGLARISSVEVGELMAPPTGGAIVLSDVINPLVGPTGAATVFGPQKGLHPPDIDRVDASLAALAEILGVDPHAQGAGAAGGTGMALIGWGAQIVPGATKVADLVGLNDALAQADLVITGEGSFDGQSAGGKAPGHLVRLATERAIPVAVIAGKIGDGADLSQLTGFVSLTELAGSATAPRNDPRRWLQRAGADMARGLSRLFPGPLV